MTVVQTSMHVVAAGELARDAVAAVAPCSPQGRPVPLRVVRSVAPPPACVMHTAFTR